MPQPDDKTQWVIQAGQPDDASANGLGDRIAEALKRLADLLFPVPDDGRQLAPIPVRIRQ